MPNYCLFNMRVEGDKRDIKKFEKYLNCEKSPSFARVFSWDRYDENTYGNRYECFYSGDCAWSVYSCMTEGTGNNSTYVSRNDDCISLQEASQKHNLRIEVYSTEPGMCFAEHYLYENGIEYANEEREYISYFWDRFEYPNFEDFKNDYELDDDLKEEDFIEDEFVVGGFDEVWTLGPLR